MPKPNLPPYQDSSHDTAHSTRTLLYTRTTALDTTGGQPLVFPRGCQIVSWWMNLKVAPSGGSFICNATVDGESIFEDADLPTITTGLKVMDEVRVIGANMATISDGQEFVIKPDTITAPAAGLEVWLEIDIAEGNS